MSRQRRNACVYPDGSMAMIELDYDTFHFLRQHWLPIVNPRLFCAVGQRHTTLPQLKPGCHRSRGKRRTPL
jgi:hypothetical protein